MPVELTKVSIDEFNSLPKDKTVFFFPVGTLEDYGPHLPMGCSVFEAQELCKLSAEKVEENLNGWKAVIMPAAPLGVEGHTTDFALTVRPHVLRDWLVDSCMNLKKRGFKHFVCFSGNLGPKQLTAIEEAGKRISGPLRFMRMWSSAVRPSLISARSTGIPGKIVMTSPLWPDADEHGGKRDTSVALKVVPDFVQNFSKLPEKQNAGSFITKMMNRALRKQAGYWGSPASATPAEGGKLLTTTVDDLFPKFRAVWEGANPDMIFRSWYSIIPLNKSNFKAWVMAIVIFLMAIFGVYSGLFSPL
jgi:creatinine amidohydrolase/Fe(II)-dependent formamide hydrolase-like protein